MKFLLYIVLVVLFFVGLSHAQYRDNVRRHTAAERMDAHDKLTARQAERVGATDRFSPSISSSDGRVRKIVDKVVRSFAEKLSESKRLIEPQVADLMNNDFKLLRMFDSFTCDAKTRKTANRRYICNELEAYGGHTFFSFRKEIYGYESISDITFINGEIVASGYMNHGFLVDLGTVSVDSIDLSSNATPSIVGIKPAKSEEEFLEIQRELQIGYKFDGVSFSSRVEAKPGHTFLGRFVAYQAEKSGNVAYTSAPWFSFDNRRRDVIVVFHVLSIEPDGGPTIIWRLLKSTESPKI